MPFSLDSISCCNTSNERLSLKESLFFLIPFDNKLITLKAIEELIHVYVSIHLHQS